MSPIFSYWTIKEAGFAIKTEIFFGKTMVPEFTPGKTMLPAFWLISELQAPNTSKSRQNYASSRGKTMG